eukprot:SAG31_NODE_22776_length_518_cov_0.739857_1_plen_124_part_10
MDFTREIQRAVDEGILTLRGRQAGLKRCQPKTEDVPPLAPRSVAVQTVTIRHSGATLANPRLRCPRHDCAYGSLANEARQPPSGTISRAHLDPTGRGPHDWYLIRRQFDNFEQTQFDVGRYDTI